MCSKKNNSLQEILMKIQNTQKQTQSAFIPQAESASKLEIGFFIVFVLIIAGAFCFVFAL
jgi:hypothetical protein